MASLSVITLVQQWIDARNYAEFASRNLVTILQHDIERTVDTYNISLTSTAAQVENEEVMRLPSRLRNAILFDSIATDTSARLDLGTTFVVDKNGTLVIDAQRDPVPVTNVADRAYFQVHARDPDRGLFISEPITSRLKPGQEVIVLSRRINKADGSFDGVVGMGIKQQYFTRLLSSVKLSEQSSLTLVTKGGVIVARLPAIATALPGSSAANSGLLKKIYAASEGSFMARSGIDGIRRLYTFGHLPGTSMIIVVGPSEKEVFSGWWRRAAIIGMLMVVFSAALQFMSLLLMAELKSRKESEAQMRALARTDSLTGLATRRVFDEVIVREHAIAKRSKRALALLFIDVDYFKSFNDAYGHQAGDQALVKIAGVIAAGIRYGSDSAARYGGEEFVLLLADTPQSDAIDVAERLRLAVAALDIPHTHSPLGHLTISMGVANYDGNTTLDVNGLIELADEWLYQAKRLGRNRVYSAAYMSS
jgi:diguanylate cyclase (GGDEF)-like protein